MPSIFIGLLEDCESYEGKNGYGCNVVLSAKVGKKTKRVSFRTKDKFVAEKIESLLDEEIVVVLECQQNNFGTSFREVIKVYDDVAMFLADYAEKFSEVA